MARPRLVGLLVPLAVTSFLLRVFAAFSYPKTVLKRSCPILNSSLTRFENVRRPLLQPIFSASALKIEKWLHQNCTNIQPGPVVRARWLEGTNAAIWPPPAGLVAHFPGGRCKCSNPASQKSVGARAEVGRGPCRSTSGHLRKSAGPLTKVGSPGGAFCF